MKLGGLPALCRRLPSRKPCILMFHGVRVADEPRLLEQDLHVPIDLFRDTCRYLRKNAQVVSLESMVEAIQEGRPLPSDGVVLTFDDGYASNYELAYPVLRELDLPATIFPATGFLDGEDVLWFNQLDFALANTRRMSLPAGFLPGQGETPLTSVAEKKKVLVTLLGVAKTLPQEQIPSWISSLEEALEVRLREANPLPPMLRPLTWDQVREMRAGGLIDIGGHTHHHWILGRCSPSVSQSEIAKCRQRFDAELGPGVKLFAYPNGWHGDFNDTTAAQLQAHGFQSAVTTLYGRVHEKSDVMELRRYGTPVSVADADMTVSGAYEKVKGWRQRFKRIRSKKNSGAPSVKRKPTVLHVIRSLGSGGAEMMLCNLVEQMKNSSWRTVVVSVIGGNASWQLERVRQAADALYTLDERPALRLRHVKKLRAIIRQERPDVVQTWIHRMDLAGGMVARAAGCRRVVWGLHSLGMLGSPGENATKVNIYRWMLRMASRFVPRLIVSCSNAGIRTHEEAGYPRRRMVWIPNGISTERFSPDPAGGLVVRRELGIPDTAPLIGFIGRFHPVKGLPVFLRAALLLQKEDPDAHFLLCGGTEEELEPDAVAALHAMPRPEQVHLIPYGGVPQRFYPALTLFSMSSSSEALPMVLLEAMATGIPCVATDVGDCAEVIGGLGRVVPPGNEQALAAAWKEMLQLPVEARADLARRVRERVVENFSVQTCAQQYEAAYSRLMETH